MKLNRNCLKYLVIVAMVIDHIAWAFVPYETLLGQLMHLIGRLTGPTMAFFLAEGYAHTRNVKRYALRLGVFALISWVPFSLFEMGRWPGPFGVIFTLFLGLCAILVWDRTKLPKWVKVLCIIGLCILSLVGDWPVFDVLWPLFLYRYRESRKGLAITFCIGGIVNFLISFRTPLWLNLNSLGVFLVPLLILFCYSGEPGSRKGFHKWFFYVFYPAHLLVLYLLKLYL